MSRPPPPFSPGMPRPLSVPFAGMGAPPAKPRGYALGVAALLLGALGLTALAGGWAAYGWGVYSEEEYRATAPRSGSDNRDFTAETIGTMILLFAAIACTAACLGGVGCALPDVLRQSPRQPAVGWGLTASLFLLTAWVATWVFLLVSHSK